MFISITRRKFILMTAAAPLAGKLLAKNPYEDEQDSIFARQDQSGPAFRRSFPYNAVKILPPALKKGSLIAVTAPASPTSYWEMRHSLKALKKLGFKIEVGRTIKDRKARDRYLSAPDDMRADEFMGFIRRKDVDGILCGRGGYGVMRILHKLDYSDIRNNPKPIIGFSDVTALLNAVHEKTGIVTFHGPVAASTFNDFTIRRFMEVLYSEKQFSPIKISYSTIQTLVEGKASGRLVGGNLSLLSGALGTEYEIDARDSILFIEETSEQPYKIDKMLTQLRLAGKLEQANGFVIGYFKGLNSKRSFYPGGSFTIKQVLDQIFKPLGKPTIIGAPIGHVRSKLTLPIGTMAELNATEKSLAILEQSVEI